MPSPLGVFSSKSKAAKMLDKMQQRDQPAFLGVTCSATTTAPSKELAPSISRGNVLPNAKPRILIAGAGIGGLVLAVGLLNKGFEVQMFERDLTAIRGEGKYRGPIQVNLPPDFALRLFMTASYCSVGQLFVKLRLRK